MEKLLSLAFDNLSSYDGPKVRKGLRQVEGLLAQICLSREEATNGGEMKMTTMKTTTTTTTTMTTTTNRTTEATSETSAASTTPTSTPPPPPPKHRKQPDSSPATSPTRKNLGQLARDPAFREFFKLQEGFEWNVGLRLISTLDRLMAKGSDGQNDLLILSALDLIQGIMLLHPPSKGLFEREQNMNLLLDLLEPSNCPAIQSATLLTLVVAVIDHPSNTRVFEALDGLLTVTSLFKSRSTTREVKLKLVEFLYVYLMPEMPSIPRARERRRGSLPDMLQRSPSKLAGAFGAADTTDASGGNMSSAHATAVTLATADKQQLLSRYLSNVEDLVRDLGTCAPFGGVVT